MELLKLIKELFTNSDEQIRCKAIAEANIRFNIQRMKCPCGALCDVITLDGIPVSVPQEPGLATKLTETLNCYREMYVNLCVERGGNL